MTSVQFSDLKLIEPLQKALVESGYTSATPIQAAAIPQLLEGRDLLGVAQTGTGKTAAFALPILQRLIQNQKKVESKHTRVLVLTPTRELAVQIHESFQTYGKNLHLKSTVVFGGVSQFHQVKSIVHGVDVLVATPGRLLDLINQRHITLRSLEVFVLDEADRMLDMGFIHDIKKIIKMLPQKRQSLFFSATMPPDIQDLANQLLHEPIKVEVTPVSSTAEKIQQSVMYVERKNKKDLLRHVLKNKDLKKVIVFTRTKHGANQVSEVLEKNGIYSAAIHGNKSQGARQRALDSFKKGTIRVLVATDIAARGIDVDGITHVINYELPNIAESYVHRIGRTARAGAEGIAISFCDEEERAYLKDIQKLTGQGIPLDTNQPYHSMSVQNAQPLSKGKAKALIDSRFGRPSKGRNQKNRRFGGPKKASQSQSTTKKQS